jgi:hypothetical protein
MDSESSYTPLPNEMVRTDEQAAAPAVGATSIQHAEPADEEPQKHAHVMMQAPPQPQQQNNQFAQQQQQQQQQQQFNHQQHYGQHQHQYGQQQYGQQQHQYGQQQYGQHQQQQYGQQQQQLYGQQAVVVQVESPHQRHMMASLARRLNEKPCWIKVMIGVNCFVALVCAAVAAYLYYKRGQCTAADLAEEAISGDSFMTKIMSAGVCVLSDNTFMAIMYFFGAGLIVSGFGAFTVASRNRCLIVTFLLTCAPYGVAFGYLALWAATLTSDFGGNELMVAVLFALAFGYLATPLTTLCSCCCCRADIEHRDEMRYQQRLLDQQTQSARSSSVHSMQPLPPSAAYAPPSVAPPAQQPQ